MTENFRGALLMTICMGAFVLNDAFVRLAGSSLPLGQILFLRGLITTFILLMVGIYSGAFKLIVSKADKWRIFFRSIAEALTAYFFSDCCDEYAICQCNGYLTNPTYHCNLSSGFSIQRKSRNISHFFDFNRVFRCYDDYKSHG